MSAQLRLTPPIEKPDAAVDHADENAFPPETNKFMSWTAIQFINSPTSHMLDVTIAVLFSTLVISIFLSFLIKIDVSVTVPAEITANGVREIVSPINGLITHLYKKNGETVKSGELIARIEMTDEAAEEVDRVMELVASTIKKLEKSNASLSLEVSPLKVNSLKIFDPVILQSLADVEHAIYNFQVKKTKILNLNQSLNNSKKNPPLKNSEIYYNFQRIQVLTKKLNKMKASSQRQLLLPYIESAEEEIGRLKTQIASIQIQAKAELEQAYSNLFRYLRVSSGVLDQFKQNHEARAVVAGVIGRINPNDKIHVSINQTVATVIPESPDFRADIQMNSKDFVRVKKGQKVFYKVEAYPYQRYGLFTGEVMDFEPLKENRDFHAADGNDKFVLHASILPPVVSGEAKNENVKFIFGMRAESTVVMYRKSIGDIIIDKFFRLKDL